MCAGHGAVRPVHRSICKLRIARTQRGQVWVKRVAGRQNPDLRTTAITDNDAIARMRRLERVRYAERPHDPVAAAHFVEYEWRVDAAALGNSHGLVSRQPRGSPPTAAGLRIEVQPFASQLVSLTRHKRIQPPPASSLSQYRACPRMLYSPDARPAQATASQSVYRGCGKSTVTLGTTSNKNVAPATKTPGNNVVDANADKPSPPLAVFVAKTAPSPLSPTTTDPSAVLLLSHRSLDDDPIAMRL
jgi:hypothetical protein